jgi:hypothetical protein
VSGGVRSGKKRFDSMRFLFSGSRDSLGFGLLPIGLPQRERQGLGVVLSRFHCLQLPQAMFLKLPEPLFSHQPLIRFLF